MSLATSVGLVSGLNFNDIISKLLAVNARPIQVLQSRQDTLARREAALQSVNKALLTLKESLQNLDAESDFNRRTITVGNKDILTATASNSAAEGEYSVQVVQLATNHRMASAGIADSNLTPIAAADGVFAFRVGDGAARSYSVSASTTLEELRDAINADSDSGVRASIINDGSDTNAYRLVLTGTKSGADNAVTITTNNTSLTFTTLQTANDAIIEVDGIQITRSTNSITDAIDGVTIDALKVDASPTTITVRNDNQNAQGLIQKFVSDYNALVDALNKDATFDPKTNVRGVLFGDATIRGIRSTLQTLTSSAVARLTGDNSLGAAGIKLGSDGKLTVDASKLSSAITDKFDALKKIFAEIGASTSTSISYVSSTTETVPGNYEVNITAAAERATITGAQAIDVAGITLDETLTFTMNGKTVNIVVNAGSTLATAIERLNQAFETEGLSLTASDNSGSLKIESHDYGSKERFSVVSDRDGALATQLGIGTTVLSDTGVDVAGTIGGFGATGKGQTLTGIAGSQVDGLKLRVTAIGPTTGTISVTKGIAHRLAQQIDSITDSTDGLIKTKSESIQKSIDQLTDRIETLEGRLLRQEENLRRQFTGLETRLSALQSQGNFLLSQLASLTVPSAR